MKNLFYLAGILIILSTSCNQAKVKQLEEENTQLKKELKQRDEDINSFMQVFNEIEENLAQVRAKEQLITKQAGPGETGHDRVASVKSDIRAIDQLMQQNKENLKKLSGKLGALKVENKQMKKMIENLENTIISKNMEILGLVDQLESMNYEVEGLYTSIADLRAENIEQDRIINLQQQRLNTAYYIIGTEKELKEKGIITKTGGFIGIGRVKQMTGNVDEKLFTKIDIQKTKVFPINARKVNLVTNHPADSYIIRKNDEGYYYSFEITQPEKFWERSKYMVLVLKKRNGK